MVVLGHERAITLRNSRELKQSSALGVSNSTERNRGDLGDASHKAIPYQQADRLNAARTV